MRQKRTVAHSVVELQTAFIGETRRPRSIQVSGFHGADNRSYIKIKLEDQVSVLLSESKEQ